MKLWLCGQYKFSGAGGTVWEFQGIFSTRDLAIAACRKWEYFIVQVDVDAIIPDESEIWPGVEYPLAIQK